MNQTIAVPCGEEVECSLVCAWCTSAAVVLDEMYKIGPCFFMRQSQKKLRCVFSGLWFFIRVAYRTDSSDLYL